MILARIDNGNHKQNDNQDCSQSSRRQGNFTSGRLGARVIGGGGGVLVGRRRPTAGAFRSIANAENTNHDVPLVVVTGARRTKAMYIGIEKDDNPESRSRGRRSFVVSKSSVKRKKSGRVKLFLAILLMSDVGSLIRSTVPPWRCSKNGILRATRTCAHGKIQKVKTVSKTVRCGSLTHQLLEKMSTYPFSISTSTLSLLGVVVPTS